MKIITIEREFGSGGRELGKRLADALGVPCYDQEIIDEVARLHGLDPAHVERISESDVRTVYPVTIGRRFSVPNVQSRANMKILVSQQEVIKSLARQGDCVVVGHCADVVLRDLSPMNLFVYANQDSKLARCLQRAKEGEDQHTILRQMRQIDRNRAGYRDLLSDVPWGWAKTYHLCLDTSNHEIKTLIPALAEYVKCWFSTRSG